MPKLFNLFRDLKTGRDGHEFKPLLVEIIDQPVNPLGRTLFYGLLIFLILTLLWCWFGKVDIVVTARGNVLPKGDIKKIQSLEAGVIERILVEDGSYVKQGQVLMEISPDITSAQLTGLSEKMAQTQMNLKRLRSLSNAETNQNPGLSVLQKQALEASRAQLSNQIAARQLELTQNNERLQSLVGQLEANKTLRTTLKDREARQARVLDIIPRTDYQQTQDQLTQVDSQIQDLSHKITEGAMQKDRILKELASFEAQFKSESLKEMINQTDQMASLKSELEQTQFKHEKQTIIAPVSGYVVKLAKHTLNGVVSPAEVLLTIVPENTPLVIQAQVKNQDIGFIKPGMAVKIKVDTFNFQKYGILKGKVLDVAKTSSETPQKERLYTVLVQPLETSLMVDGRRESLQSGMTTSAEIQVGTRRIIEFFVYPLIRYMDEGISVK